MMVIYGDSFKRELECPVLVSVRSANRLICEEYLL